MANVSVEKVVANTRNVYTLELSENEAEALATVLCCVKGSTMTSRNFYCSNVLKVLLEEPGLSEAEGSKDIEGYLQFT